jgi:peptide/nickel transport system substrate-binding protein
MWRRSHLYAVMLVAGVAVSGTAGAGVTAGAREGGILRIMLAVDYVDPALSYSIGGWSLLDTTCARLMTYPDKPPPEGLRLVPEVAVDVPRISRNAKTYTFTLRKSFRFSDGKPVRASAFARAINRVLALGPLSPGMPYTRDIAGAADVAAGRRTSAEGVVARGNKLTIRFTRPIVDFAAKTTMPFFCAVPPGLPPDPEGAGAIPSAGPYVITEYRHGERATIRRNRFYGGSRPHHLDGFDVVFMQFTGGADALDQVERGEVDWAQAGTATYFDPGRRLAAKYGVNRAQFFVKPGLTLRHIVFNTSGPLFGGNPRLRRAVNFAIDRPELQRIGSGSMLSERLTDQLLPPSMPGYENETIYPLDGPNLSRARELARGNLRGGKGIILLPDSPQTRAISQAISRQLARIGLDLEVKPVPGTAYQQRLRVAGEPWDLAGILWAPDFNDPSAYVNTLFDGRLGGGTNVGWFDSARFNRMMRRTSRLEGASRYRAYGELDVRLMRDAAPSVPVSFFNQPTLVSKRVGCIVLRPALDLTAACLK